MEFEKRKAATLASLGCTETDKSPKGTLDTPIIPLLDAINCHPCYFTTSSCSGRISILSQPSPAATSKPKKKASGGSWLFITHDSADPDSVLNLLFPSSESTQCHHPSQLVFRFEPLIVAVECKDLASAQSLVSIAIASGFRESGITSANKRFIIAIRCSIRLELPLGDTQKIMVSPEYVRYLVEIANEKMEANRKRTEGFLRALQSNGFVGSSVDDGSSMKGSVKDNKSASACGAGGSAVACNGGQDREPELQGRVRDAHSGSIGVQSSSLSIVPMVIVGEPVERLFIWGHSACTLNNTNHNEVLVFGGFGGMGRHGRRNSSLLLDPFYGTLKAFDVEGGPTPRLGHTSSLVGDCMFVIGGRADPEKVLSDVWILNIAKKEWKLLECSGNAFPPRHRHAAAVVGPNIYVFGGLNNDTISSSFHVLSTDNLQWQELLVGGKQPCPRHSHSMVAFGSQLFLFGGYSGEKALGDLYSFNLKTYQWKKETTAGKSPHARFSHSMFVYKNCLGVIGGCPVRQHFEELSILDLHYRTWRHVKLNSVGKDLFVRSTANVVGDDLVMVGGGASCYAFGAKFSEPLKINLLPLHSLDDNLKPAEIQREHVFHQSNGKSREKDEELQDPQTENMQTLTEAQGLNCEMVLPVASDRNEQLASYWVLQLERKHAKMGKDILKKFRWLDLERKVYSSEDGTYICFPVNEKFCELFCEKQHSLRYGVEGQDNNIVESVEEGSIFNEADCLKALNILKEHGATKQRDEVVEIRKIAKSPLKKMNEAVAFLINKNGLPVSLLEELPTRWERLGDIIVLPVSSFQSHLWDSIAKELWPTIAKSLNTPRLARQGRVASTGTRDSSLEILVGDSGWVDHRENGIIYSFDATKCMFSWGNLSEKLRMARLDCRNEVIVDLFAGIGYFVLPFLVRAKAKLVYACEWNPHAVEALYRNLQSNSVIDRCIILEGDNKITAPKGVADRVCLGLLPTSEGSWVTAVRALRSEGGILHIHGNVKDGEEGLWTEHILNSIHEIANNEGYCWEIKIEHLERVKWYAPHIRHVVADVRCRQTQR